MDAAQAGDGAAVEPRFQVTQHSLTELGKRFWPFLRPHRWRLLIGCGLIAVAGAAYGIMPLFSKYLIDRAIPDRSLTLAALIGGLFVGSQMLRMNVWYLAMILILHTQEKINFALRSQSFGHLQRLSLRFHSQHPSGYLYESVFGTAIRVVAGCMQTLFKQLSLYIAALFFSLACCLWLSVPMTGVVLLGSCGYVLIAHLLRQRIYDRNREAYQANMQITDFIVDRLRGTKTIQTLTLEDRVQGDFQHRLWPAQMKSLAATKERFRLSQLTEGCGYFVTASIMVAGAYSIFEWDLTIGELVAFMGYQTTFVTIVATLTNVYGDFAGARAGMDQLFTILDTPSTVVDKHDAAVPERIRGDLTFDKVDFGYEPDRPVLRGLDLHVPMGQTVALVGPSGGGKTTIANLLLRFYDPDRGRVLLDGHDIRDLPLRGYRALFSVVLQDPYFFNESVADNLRFARPDATDEELVTALKRARAWEFVSELPDGLEAKIGESGGSLSGGQRQRLAIARCLLLQSRFVILDEPTSALDVESEKMVQQAFDELFAERTVFIIAHRLSTIRRADRILVLDEGQVVQDGPFTDLVAKPGPFRRLYEIAMEGMRHPADLEAAAKIE